MTSPAFTDILHAKQTIAPYLSRTPLAHYPALDKLCGTRILVKHENQQLTGAFKVRGGINLISQLSAEERERGVITASTGNHGQSIAYAARISRFAMQPGDCLVFQAMIVHGARGNTGLHRRRALATRWAGDDARCCRRPGEIAIPTEDPGLVPGERLDCERFPLVWTA